jgi:hypothetical protein
MSETDIVDENWPRAELVGGPMDGHKILKPADEYIQPLAIPQPKGERQHAEQVFPGEIDPSDISLHWYMPMTKFDSIRKLSLFYYAYAGETDVGEEMPTSDTLLDRSTTVDIEFPEDVEE